MYAIAAMARIMSIEIRIYQCQTDFFRFTHLFIGRKLIYLENGCGNDMFTITMEAATPFSIGAPSAPDIHSAHRSQPAPAVVAADLPAATSGCYSASCSMTFSPTARPDAPKFDTPPVPTSPNGVCDEALQLF